MVRRLALLLWLCTLAPGCGDQGPSWSYDGQLGQATALSLAGWVPQVQLVLEHGAPISAIVDSGSPLTVVDVDAAAAAVNVTQPTTLQAFGLTFADFPLTVAPLFEPSAICQEEPQPRALVGGDLLREFLVHLDYRGKTMALHESGPLLRTARDPVEPGADVELQLLGGGVARLSGVDDEIHVPATRVVLDQVELEGQPAHAVLDTGASYTVVRPSLLQRLGQDGRPELCCVAVSTIYGTTLAPLSRISRLRVGPHEVVNQPVLVSDFDSFFDAMSREVGREVELLIGGSLLRRFAVELDYPARTLRLSRYVEQDHVDPLEFRGPGFTLCRSAKLPGAFAVADIFNGSSAAQQGIRTGDVLVRVGDQSVVGLELDQVQRMLRGDVGSSLLLFFAGDVRKTVQVQQLLADFK